ncbi:MAG TPA: phosphopantetheine-binding protein, partial [Terriglobales bacterium]|nr:phosphopantetheine-binding protein [Terriglobales bacterium]
LPFDRRRHGMIVGMGAAALVVESAEAARERGIRPICEVLSTITANSAFHGTRLDVQHISQVMEDVLALAERRSGIRRQQIAPQTVFVSHETYTPARGGSAAAEINALRSVFGSAADQIVIANTKGYTGHAMGAGIEDVLAVKALETGIVPPITNFKEVDPELGMLNLSKGGKYPVTYALRLAAGFGSQISMALLRWVATNDGIRPGTDALGYASRIADTDAWQDWLNRIAQHLTADLEVVNRTLRVRDQGAPGGTADAAKGARVITMPAPTTPAPHVIATVGAVAEPAAIKKAVPVVRAEAAAPAPLKPTVAATAVLEPPVAAATEVDKPKPAAVEVAPVPVIKATETAELATPAPIEKSARGGASVKERILALVVEKTGYPQDMLDLDLDLEADLGIDTVKQAEMFAAIRETYNIPRDENRKLRDYPTLAHVIRFVYEKRPDLASAPAAAVETPIAAPAASAPASSEVVAAVPAPSAIQAPSEDSIKERVLGIVAEKTGYPKDMLDLDLDLEADLGIDTVKQAEMFAAIREAYGIPRDQNLKLRDFPTLAHVIRFAIERQPGAAAVPAATPPATAAAASGPVEAPVVEPVPAPVPAAAKTPTVGSIKEKVLEIVAEKTGYPKDMLDLDLDLEADLGIDTVKQAEMFAAIRAAYGIPRDQNLKLRDFPTLAHVIRFAVDRQPGAAAPSAVAPPPAAAEVQPPVAATVEAPAPVPAPKVVQIPTVDSIREKVLEIVAEKTGYPKDMLDLDLDLEADLGIDTVKQAEMFAAIREAYGIPRDQNLKLRDFPTLAHVIRFAIERQPGAAAAVETAPAQVAAMVQAPPATPAPVAAPTPSTDSIKEKVLEIVAEKTGYPKDMLDLDLDLEADLGIDTVKQAEMFAAIRAAYGIPRDQNLKLRDFPTLAHVIRFAIERQPGAPAAQGTATEQPVAPATTPAAAPAAVAGTRPNLLPFDAANQIPRRLPVPTVRPPLSLCKTTAVTLGQGRRVVIMPDSSGVADALARKLQSMGVETLRISGAPDADALTSQLRTWLNAGPVHGVYWLPALTREPVLSEMDANVWREALRVRVKLLFTTMRALYEQVAPAGTFLVSATRLGGQHGYDETGAVAPLGGAVTGFTKAYKRERPEALVKTVDFESQGKAEEIADILVAETLRDTGAVEIGYKADQRWTVTVEERPAADGKPGMVLDKSTVFLVTGAAGSIVSAITADLAAASGG